ncbi:lanthionine synthetase LanC family protein [Pontibacter sp. G13]|uniref:lanthionine synthetase LanC family protein n=1 Tax=Pontibacter sp. G13 TaxID=3074898 RepID=UPI00288AD8E3|nr:lanthionine synthetase LanC family protein [Pontibacter sp. G13]WNJ17537.1 lanthionine synthetase LanC family protein [Pontibacter sp. G13]
MESTATQLRDTQIALIRDIFLMTQSHLPDEDGWFDGRLGYMLFDWYYRLSFELDLDPVGEAFSDLLGRLNEGNSSLTDDSLSKGMTGLALVLNHFHQEFQWEVDDLLADLDQMVIACIEERILKGEKDFYHQATGLLHYLIQRLAQNGIEQVVDHCLDLWTQTSTIDLAGLRYRSSMGQGAGVAYDLGLAHGLTGFLLTISPLVDHPRLGEKAITLVQAGLRYYQTVAAKASTDERTPADSEIPVFVGVDQPTVVRTNRMAYCYGDIGPLLVWERTRHFLSISDQQKLFWDQIHSKVCAAQTPEKTGIDDAHLCHGSAGIALMFRALNAAHPQKAYLDGYEFWVEKTWQYAQEDLATGAYAGGPASLLEGFSGVGLACLTFLYGSDWNWPSLFLLPTNPQAS